MKHIQVVAKSTICRDKNTGCGECQASCQSACKTCEQKTGRVEKDNVR